MAPPKKQAGQDVAASRSQDNTVDTQFHLLFLERVYDGAPRWWKKEWEKHYVTPSGDNGDRLDRESEVKKVMASAHDWKRLFNADVPFLITCVTHNCPLRTWTGVYFKAVKQSFVKSVGDFGIGKDLSQSERNALMTKIYEDGLMRMANGKELEEKCPNCGNSKLVFGFATIQNKWVYVLKGGDDPLTPHAEIDMETPTSGWVYEEFHKGTFTKRRRPFPGFLTLEKIHDEVWHFFLSPVRLGPQALSLLSQILSKDFRSRDDRIQAAKPSTLDVGVQFTQQPWNTVVTRQFTPSQTKTPLEFIPLVDPIAWVAQIADLDYLPVIAAWKKLMLDPNEQAKAFIAATLAPRQGREQAKDAPEKSDPWNLGEETVEPPEEFKSSGNIAKAWVDRYNQALEYLTTETNYACCRVFFPVKFSLAHRIVELACQEDKDTTDPKRSLDFGLTHWAHILREMLVCEAGEAFILWVAKHKDAADRIPQKNVLKGVGLKSGKIASAIKLTGLPAQILMYLSPVLIRGSKKPEETLRGYLGEIDIAVPMDWKKAILAPDTVHPLADIAFEIPDEYIKHYIEKFPKSIKVDQFHAVNGAISWKARIQGVSRLKDVLRVFALLDAVAEFGKEYKGPDTEWGRFGHSVEKIETAVKIGEFFGHQSKALLEEGFSGSLTEVEKQIQKKVLEEGLQKLGPYADHILEASNALKVSRAVGVAGKVLSGPAGLVTGGLELVLQSKEAEEAMESGDVNAVLAHRVQAIAGALVVEVGAVEALAAVGELVGSEALAEIGEAAWLGPVGWIAAALMILGEIFLAYCKKSDFELYAGHCFFGRDAGLGGSSVTKYPWMGFMGWSQLENPQNGRRALLRLVSGFSVWIGWYPRKEVGPWWQIKAGYIPTGAYFEVEVDFWNLNDKSAKVTQKAKILGDGTLKMDDSTGCSSEAHRNSDGTSLINVLIVPRSLFTNQQDWKNVKFEWSVRVRLVFDGVSALPVKGWLENEHGSVSSMTSTSGE